MALRRNRAITVARVRDLSPSVRGLVFAFVDRAPLAYVAGQYVDLYVPTASGIVMKRPYSIASAPGVAGPHHVEVAVTHVPGGPTSAALHALVPGDPLELDGPFGGFTRQGAADGPALFVGAGTGLAPLRAMIQAELDRPRGPPLTLLFGCRTPADLLWADELRAWPSRSPRVRVEVTLSRPPPTWGGRRGYVQAHVEGLCADAPPADVYVCGLPPMVEGVVDALVTRVGLPPGAVHAEEYV